MLPISRLSDLSEDEKLLLCNRYGADFSDVLINTVIPIVQDVQTNGDRAVLSYTKKFDGVTLDTVLCTPNEIESQAAKVDKFVISAFTKAYDNIHEFHSHQRREDITYTRRDGSRLGMLYRPIERAAVYVPGGKASYPSSVLMGAVPARIAGVKTLTIVTPPDEDGMVPPGIAAVSTIAGVDTIIKSGGAHGIAAAGAGTQTVSKSDLVVGPGNIYVTAAKTYLFSLGLIQIDSMAGPSEVLIIADDSADPEWVAWDLLSQAEHEERALALLLTTSKTLADEVNGHIQRDIDARRGRHDIKTAALKQCRTFLVDSIEEAVSFSNRYAPEHMQMMVTDPEHYLDVIQNVGSLFLGHYSPVAVGDFISGTNHILPTGGAARFSSGLSVDTFMHRMTYQNVSPEALKDYMPYTDIIAGVEGFDDKHGASIRKRFER
ncbi:MAG: histidinol dehydrogenase [Spirochaetota bacterium]